MEDFEWYEFDNGWTMRRESAHPYYWILRDERFIKVERGKYRNDLIERHNLVVSKHYDPHAL